VNDKLEMTHKEEIVAHFKIILEHLIEGGGKLKETVIRTESCNSEFQTQDPPNK
jgi:hypothetical protein